MSEEAYPPLEALWVRFGKGGTIIGQWSFEPFPPEMCEAMGVIKYVRESQPEAK